MRVGRYCSIAKTVRAAPRNHPMSSLTTYPALYEKSFGVVAADALPPPPLVIEDDVWIGHYAMVLPGCKYIGRGAIIGAGAIVTRDVPRYTVVAGNPAAKIRDRFEPALAAAIESSEWWTMELRDLAELARESPDVLFEPTVDRIYAWKTNRAVGGNTT
jgi:acetyltransferase-like isoleucine patch superfamily enzyme